MEEKVFKSNFYALLFCILRYSILFGFLCWLALLFITGEEKLYLYIAVIIGLVVAALITLLKYNISVHVTPHEIQLVRFDRAYVTIPRHSHAVSAHITKHSINLIPTHTTRELVVGDGSGKYKRYTCHNFSKETFDALYTEINVYSLPSEAESETQIPPESTSGMTQRFEVPRGEIVQIGKKKFVQISMVMVIPIALVLLWCIIYGDNPMVSSTLMFGFLFIPVFPILVQAILYFGMKRRVPALIEISGDKLTIDDISLHTWQIQKVKITPATYTSALTDKRKLTIHSDISSSYYLLGNTFKRFKSQYVYSDYGELCLALEQLFTNEPNKFSYDL